MPRCYAMSIAATFKTIHELLIHHNDLSVGDLDIVSADDKKTMQLWNPVDPYCAERRSCMHHLVEFRAREAPTSEAICAWDGSLTYAELDRLSDFAAYKLRRAGVCPGIYVPFAFDKSLWAVVATLAIMKSGGAFVPLNPRDPPARLAEICRSVGARTIATTSSLVKLFESMVENVIDVSSETLSLERCNGAALDGDMSSSVAVLQDAALDPADPIFVLFTSGSTGKPKGMIHTHASICTHATTHGEAMGYHGKRVLQFAAHTFDVAFMDFFTTLLFGGCICIPSEEDRRTNIVTVINAMGVDYAILTPSLAGLIEPCEVPTLKTLAIGGEALPQDRIERWADKVHFIQIYGPAEVGICLLTEMQPTTSPEIVGYPLPNSSCWLVDPDNSDRLVPIGAVGELVVAGPSLAQGYVNDEAKTRLAFIDVPTWAKAAGLPYQRMYKTGDLLKYDVSAFDGSYAFIGRKDAQIKLRGQRIEPGEVEYYIGRLPGVVMAMVTKPKDGCFAEELVSIVQLQHINGQRRRMRNEPIRLANVQALSIVTVRESLAKVLPSYMIPKSCLIIDSFPLVPSMKIDRPQVNAWLAGMDTRLGRPYLCTLARLGNHENTARALSFKVAEVVDNKDNACASVLQNHDFLLQETGINSIQIMSLSMYLQNQYGRKVPMDVLLSSSTTIRHLSQLLDSPTSLPINGHEAELGYSPLPWKLDFNREAHSLFSNLLAIVPQQQHPENQSCQYQPVHNILLTGVTGYLGISIFQHLLILPSTYIYALVRCSNPSTGLANIIATAKSQGWWQDSYATRIRVWAGDLSKPLLGLSDADLSLLRGAECANEKAVHAIIHNGAKVHYSSDYQSLKAVNVLSTVELLRVAAQAPRLSDFVFVSGGFKPSLDTCSAGTVALEEIAHAGGYAQTKFVCEQIMEQCETHAAFATKRLHTIRPGYIAGSLSKGLANRKDFLWRLVAGCVEIGAFNRDEAERWLYIASVDYVAEHVTACIAPSVLERSTNERTERVLSGLYFSELWAVVEDVCGCRLEPLEGKVWMQKLIAKVLEVGDMHLLFPLLDVLQRDGESLGEVERSKDLVTREDTKAVVRRNLEHLIETGFLPTSGSTRFGKLEGDSDPIEEIEDSF